MVPYRRNFSPGGTYFFTVTLAAIAHRIVADARQGSSPHERSDMRGPDRHVASLMAGYTLVQPQLCDVARVGFQLAALDALDEVGQHGVGTARKTHLVALAHHKTVEEFDFG